MKTYLVIIGTTIGSGADSSKAPCIHKSVERMVIAVLKEERHDHALKEVGLEYLPGAAMWHPGNDVVEFLLRENRVQLDGKLLHADGTLQTVAVVVVALFFCLGLFGHVTEVTVLVKRAATLFLAFQKKPRDWATCASAARFLVCVTHVVLFGLLL